MLKKVFANYSIFLVIHNNFIVIKRIINMKFDDKKIVLTDKFDYGMILSSFL